jgi:predicted 2-oxoglutarate/Fe(II)-dependent dioxygenase YbiX
MRYCENGDEDYENVGNILDEIQLPIEVDPGIGSLMIFRGNTSLHRVTEISSGQRILITLNYNRQPNISLSETSRMTFFGRIN